MRFGVKGVAVATMLSLTVPFPAMAKDAIVVTGKDAQILECAVNFSAMNMVLFNSGGITTREQNQNLESIAITLARNIDVSVNDAFDLMLARVNRRIDRGYRLIDLAEEGYRTRNWCITHFQFR